MKRATTAVFPVAEPLSLLFCLVAAVAAVAASVAAGKSAGAQDEASTTIVQEIDVRERRVQWPVGAQSIVEANAVVYPQGAEARFAEATIPVLAPDDLSADERRAFTESFRAVTDGYFSVVPRGDTDILINGTRSYAVAPELVKRFQRDGVSYLYQEGDGHVSISFSRYGADYLLQFECRDGEGYANDCTNEAEVVEVIDRLTIVGGTPQ
jgi:hypothetical protein